MTQEKKFGNICSEVYECLNLLGNDYISKIPEKIYKELENGRDENYVSKYDENKGITEETFSQDALNVLAALDLKFWCSEEERKLKEKLYLDNQKEQEEIAKEKYNIEEIFKKEEKEDENKLKIKKLDETALIEVEEKDIFTKIKNWIVNFIGKFIK